MKLSLHRYRPKGGPAYREPVLMCHGLAMNRYLYDFGGNPSLAHHLRDSGFDAWTVEYRGSGMSSHPRPFDKQKADWNLDDVIQHDVPTFINKVSDVVEGAPVHWIGHSTGGVVIFCYLGLEPEAPVASVVGMGTPARFERMRHLSFFFRLLRFLEPTRVMRNEGMSQLTAGLWGTFRFWPFKPLIEALLNPQNVPMRTLRRCMVNLIQNPLIPLLVQYGQWIRTGKTQSADGSIDYDENLGKIRTPALLVAGPMDPNAPPDVTQWLSDHLGSETKQVHIASQENGTRYDYGHGDLLLGQHVEEEIFPVVKQWLVERSTPIQS